MPKTKSETKTQLRERAKHWRQFRERHLLTQVMLSTLMGVSRRAVQKVEGEETTPGYEVLSKFQTLEKTYAREGK